MSCFQVRLGSEWTDYSKQEDKILKRAFLAGFPHARYSIRGQGYEVDFKNMQQKNSQTLKARHMRAPRGWEAPSKPICKPGPTMCIKVPAGSPGSVIQVPHPKVKGKKFAVSVPDSAKVGQAMLVSVPPSAVVEAEPALEAAVGEAAAVPVSGPAKEVAAKAAGVPVAELAKDAAKEAPKDAPPAKAAGRGWGTGAKVAACTGGVVVVGGLAAAGALFVEHVATDGWDATVAELGDDFRTLGDHIATGAEEAWHGVEGAATVAGEHISAAAVDGWHEIVVGADEAGTFIMDLF